MDSRCARAWARNSAGDRRGALEDATAAVQLAPRSGYALRVRAEVRRGLTDWSGAAADCDQAAALEAGLEAHAVRAIILVEAGEPRRALADLRAAMAAQGGVAPVTTHARSWRALGYAHAATGDWDASAAAYARAAECEPRASDNHVGRARIAAARGDVAGALAELERALALAPRGRWASHVLATVLLDAGHDPARATAACDQVLEHDPGHRLLRADRARARERLGDLAGARADLDRALETGPNDPEPWVQRALLRRRQGDLAGAREDASRARELLLDVDPRAPGLRNLLAGL